MHLFPGRSRWPILQQLSVPVVLWQGMYNKQRKQVRAKAMVVVTAKLCRVEQEWNWRGQLQSGTPMHRQIWSMPSVGEVLLHWSMGIMDGDELPEVMLRLLLMSGSWMRRASNDDSFVYHYFLGFLIAAVCPFPQLHACMRIYKARSMIHSCVPVCKQCSG